MKSRRLVITGLGLVAALSFAVAGCDNAGTPAGPTGTSTSAAAKPDAAAALAESANKLATTSFKTNATVGDSTTMTGVIDAPNNLGDVAVNVELGAKDGMLATRMIGNDVYLKMVGNPLLPTLPEKWMHLELTKVPADGGALMLRPGKTDPLGVDRLLRATTNVERVGDRGFKGTIDLTKATGAPVLEGTDAKELGEAAKAVPFEASTDDQGRLTSLKFRIPAKSGEPAQDVEAKYSDFGAKVDVRKPPASEVVEAPAMVYSLLGGG